MKKIYKYQLQTTDIQQIKMIEGAEILCIQTYRENPCIWALVDPDLPLIERTFEIYGTGHSISENSNRKYIGTYQLNEVYVFHCFELC